MGLFSSKKKVVVSSTVYNLAGLESDRPDFLKNTVVGSVLAGKASIADSMNYAYQNGPGMRFRSFARWARANGFTEAVGQVSGSMSLAGNMNTEVLKDHIPRPAGSSVLVQRARFDRGDFGYWAEQYILDVHPDKINTDFSVDFNEATSVITITFADLTQAAFVPANFDPSGFYLFATYNEVTEAGTKPLVTGTTITLATDESFPSTVEWVLQSSVTEAQTTDLVETTTTEVTYSDGSPGSTTTSSTTTPASWSDEHDVFTKTTTYSTTAGTDEIWLDKAWMYQDTVGKIVVETTVTTTEETLSSGVVKTTTTTVKTDTLVYERTHRTDTQVQQQKSWSGSKMFIYRKGGGNPTLDGLWASSIGRGDFYPYIPIRINNQFVSETHPDTLYPKVKRAFTKATGGKLSKVQDEIASNSSLPDIDFVYAVFGVSLNVKENACRRYIYNFFSVILDGVELDGDLKYAAWKADFQAAKQSWEDWIAWRNRMGMGGEGFNEPEPVRLPYPTAPTEKVQITSGNNGAMNYDMTISWDFIAEESGTGLLKPDAKRGECWLTTGTAETFTPVRWGENPETGSYDRIYDEGISQQAVFINWQVDDNSWKRLTVWSLKHTNTVYGGKSVEITAVAALADTEESGFIIPLHENIFRETGLVRGTQMATASCFLVFNSYEIKKVPWWSAGWFKILLIIAVVVVLVLTGGGGLGAGVGLLGSNAAVGASLGLVAGSAAAAVAGAIANALASMIVSIVISKAATALFGEKLGAIIGAIASFAMISIGTGVMNGASLSESFGNLMNADNLLKLTLSVGDGIGKYLQGSAMETFAKTEGLMQDYTDQAKEIQEKLSQLLGGPNVIDPMMFVDGFGNDAVIGEPLNLFLERTLLLGTDIADITLSMVGNFTEITLSTDLPIGG